MVEKEEIEEMEEAQVKFKINHKENTMTDQEMIDKIMQLCEEIIDEPLNNDNEDDYAMEIQFELEREFQGSFRCYFGSTQCRGMKASEQLLIKCNYSEDDEECDLWINYYK